VLTRVLDVAVLLLLAVVVIMPRPDVEVQAALKVDPAERDRVAELQTAPPGQTAPALELADIYMDTHHPDWALAALADALAAHPDDHRLHSRKALALADHYEAGKAYQAAVTAQGLCRAGSAAPCGETERARLDLLVSTLDRVKDLDLRKNPNEAKERVLKALRPTFIPQKRVARPAVAPAPASTPAPAPAKKP
jgi:hypothetical protein